MGVVLDRAFTAERRVISPDGGHVCGCGAEANGRLPDSWDHVWGQGGGWVAVCAGCAAQRGGRDD